MKKQYITPASRVRKIKCASILAGSEGQVKVNSTGETEEQYAKKCSSDLWDNEW